MLLFGRPLYLEGRTVCPVRPVDWPARSARDFDRVGWDYSTESRGADIHGVLARHERTSPEMLLAVACRDNRGRLHRRNLLVECEPTGELGRTLPNLCIDGSRA